MADDNEGRLTRWSRRKHQERQTRRRGGAAPTAVASVDPAAMPVPGDGDPGSQAVAVPAGGAGTPDEEALDEEAARNLPPVESLNKDSDYTPFLNTGVPEKLARAALRKMWSSDPAFNIRDGLDDYDEDFTIIEAIKDALKDKISKGADKAADDGKGEEPAEDVEGDMDEAEDAEGGDEELAAGDAEDIGIDDDEPGPAEPAGKPGTGRA